ncbi:MAG: hypothetical protein ACREOU_12355 [Candidatus Eiseniibacteriota bacterium]
MGPFLGPVASALLAALAAGLVLGVLRLGSVSLDWWRARTAPRGAVAEPAPPTESAAPKESSSASAVPGPPIDPGAFRRSASALALLAWVGALLLALGHASEAAPPSRPHTLASLIGSALQALVFGVAAASVAAVFERALGMVLHRLGRPDRMPEPGLSLAELWRNARAALPGHERTREPLGAGLATSLVFASAIGVWSVLVSAVAGHPPPALALVAGGSLLSLPLAYAVAADRTPDPGRARRRQDTALRQLLVAPVWALALLVLATPSVSPAARIAGIVALALVSGATLPGVVPPASAFLFPTRGDADAPDAAVRLFTDAAHYAWLSAWALGLALAITTFKPTPANVAGTALGLLLLLLIARRFPRPSWLLRGRFAEGRHVGPAAEQNP